MAHRHLSELKKRILQCAFFYLLIATPLFFYGSTLFSLFSSPVLKTGGTLIATDLTSTFTIPLKLSLTLAFFICLPYLLLQIWAFIKPGLYPHEKKIAYRLILLSLVLFYSGVCFAYLIVCPLTLAFFSSISPQGVEFMPSMHNYFSFIITMSLAFGACFQMPILLIFLLSTNRCSVESLAAKRAYVIVACFIIGMLLTPPDVISQILLALPLWGLFELSLLIAKYYKKNITAIL